MIFHEWKMRRIPGNIRMDRHLTGCSVSNPAVFPLLHVVLSVESDDKADLTVHPENLSIQEKSVLQLFPDR